MRTSVLSMAFMAGTTLAQGDLAGLLESQDDLSTLLEFIGMVDGLADTLANATNITIVAPTNQAFEDLPRDIPEGIAIENRDVASISALLANHVFQGYYESGDIDEVPTFAQTLLNSSYVSDSQPFSNFTGGQYNGLVKNGDGVDILSGEFTVSSVTEADITLGDGIVIHKIDTVLSFGAPLQLFTRRANLTAFNSAVEAAELDINFGNQGAETSGQNISDFTIFVPNNEAFEAIGSVLASADVETLQEVLAYHIIDDVVFSPSLGNTSVPSLQGNDLNVTVLPDGTAFVNNAKIIFPNVILFNGVAHIIDSVLNPDGETDEESLDADSPISDRPAFPDATPVPTLSLPEGSYTDDVESYTTPEILQTLEAVPTDAPEATSTSSEDGPEETNAAAGMPVHVGLVAAGIVAGVFGANI